MSIARDEEEQKIHNVLLTLISRADASGLVTRCTLADLMDYAFVERQEGMERILAILEERNLVSVVKTGKRKRQFQMQGSFENMRPKAMRFATTEAPRVAHIVNMRAKNYVSTRNLRTRGTEETEELEVTDIERIDDTIPKKYRFSVKIPNAGHVRDCVLIKYPNKPYIAGPSRKTGEKKFIYFEFEPETRRRVCDAAMRATSEH